MADRALLVGINKYPGCPLNGCVNDIMDMASFLVKYKGFDKANIRLLVDARATTKNIVERLQWLTQARPGDRVVFHYSGHGAQVATRDHLHEVDGMDEVICPVDFDWSDAHLIRDKQFHDIFKKMPEGVKFNWVSDSCHSGDLTKEMPKPSKCCPSVLRSKAYPVPADIKWRNDVARHKGHAPQGMAKVAKALADDALNVGYISGCRSDQTSADAFINGRYNGALTYFLLSALKGGYIDKSVTEVVARVNQTLADAGYDQRPQAEGARANLPLLW
jgi:hypothetical protein